MVLATIPIDLPDDAPAEFSISADLYDTERISNWERQRAQELLCKLKEEGLKRGYEVREWFDDLTLVQTLAFRRL